MFLVTTTFIIWYWIIVGIIALVVALIHAGIDNMGAFDLEDFFDAFFGGLGWLITLIVLALGGIVFAFIAWIWWAMLLIILGIFAIVGIIVLCVHLYNEHELKEYMAWRAANPEEAAKLDAKYAIEEPEDKVEEFVVKPNDKGIRFKDIAGLADAKEAFKEKVILPFEHPELFTKFGKKAGGGILLYVQILNLNGMVNLRKMLKRYSKKLEKPKRQ